MLLPASDEADKCDPVPSARRGTQIALAESWPPEEGAAVR